MWECYPCDTCMMFLYDVDLPAQIIIFVTHMKGSKHIVLLKFDIKERSCPCILFIDKLTYVTFNVFTSLCYNGISQ